VRLAASVLVAALAFGIVAVDVASAHKLSIKRARKAAYKVTRKVGEQRGAVYALAGYCKRKSKHRVNCWGAIVFADGGAAAQRIKVKLRGHKAKARRYGKVFTGTITGDAGSGGSDEWAVCTPDGACVGS
jgi:hypothetical protein